MSQNGPKPGEIYRHFKGKLYQIVTIAKHSETGEELVIYQALYGEYAVYARPLAMFVSEVDCEKYPDAKQKLRFERIEPQTEKARTGNQNAGDAGLHAEPEVAAVQNDTEPETNGEEQAAPELMRFLDAETYHEKYKVLQGMENTITDRLINDFAVILDVVIPEGELSNRFEQLKQCVSTMARYETTRLR